MKTLKTSDIIAAYRLISAAKINKIESDTDKYAIIKTTRALKKIAEEFENCHKDAVESLKGDNHDEMVALAQKWQNEENEKKPVTLTDAEKAKVNAYFAKYNNDIANCMNECFGKEHEVDVKTIGDDSFVKLMEINDWSVEQIMLLEDVFTE